MKKRITPKMKSAVDKLMKPWTLQSSDLKNLRGQFEALVYVIHTQKKLLLIADQTITQMHANK